MTSKTTYSNHHCELTLQYTGKLSICHQFKLIFGVNLLNNDSYICYKNQRSILGRVLVKDTINAKNLYIFTTLNSTILEIKSLNNTITNAMDIYFTYSRETINATLWY